MQHVTTRSDIEFDQDIHTHDSDCIEYVEVEDHSSPYQYKTGYVKWCEILDRQIVEDDYDDSDYWDQDYE